LNSSATAAPVAALRIMNRLGTTPVLLEQERPSGHDLLFVGDAGGFARLARLNAEMMQAAGVKRVVTTCAESYHVLAFHYRRAVPGFSLDVEHFLTWLEREVATRQWANVRYLLRSGSALAAGYTLTASLLLVVFGEQLIGRLWGPEFLPTTYDVLLVLLIGAFAANTLYWARRTVLALGFPGYPTMVNLVAAVLKIGVTLALVPAGGALAMAGILSVYFASTSLANAGKALLTIRRPPSGDSAQAG
jgi:hypothetical protein